MIEWLFGDAVFAGGHLVFTGAVWVIAVASVATVGALALSLRPLPLRRRAAELGLATIAAGSLVVLAARPVWLAEGERVEPGRTVVLVDASRSMAVAEADGKTRIEHARALLQRFPGAEVYHFGGDLRAGDPVAADLGTTDIGGALQALTRRFAGERLAGIVLVTDGIDRGGLLRETGGERVVDVSGLPPLPGPLTVYQTGAEASVPDLSIVDVQAGSFAFLRAPFTLVVSVESSGLDLEAVPVTLTRNGQPAGSRKVTLDADGRGRAVFEVMPDAPGRFVYEASVPVPATDAVPSNNSMTRAVRVVRDRVRVLQVCGSPSMDQKFLRLFLKEDPGVDLVSFFILRTFSDFGAGYMPEELSLIEFPYQRLFDQELSTFDLVILQNFDYGPYFERDAPRLLSNLAAYVREGGALAFIGGDRSFDLGDYANTALADVLPVALGVPGDSVDPGAFAPVLTESGARHPVTRLDGDSAENRTLWARLPGMDGTNLNLGAAPGAAVLLQHPSLEAAGGPLPVLAVRQVGKGRTLSLSVDSSWRWSFAEAGKGGGNQAYLRFWKSAMRWLVGDPDDQAVTVDVPRENVEPGEVLRVTVRVRDAGFAAVAAANVTGTVTGPEGETPISAPTGSDGAAIFEVPTAVRGAHRVKVVATAADGASLGSAETVYAVVTRDPELDRVVPDGSVLRALAIATQGRYVPPGEWMGALNDPDAGRVVRDRRESPLWSAPILGLIFAVSASASWWLRRRAGRR
ncbi:hypothetical protein LBMAG42_53650 [Deltaproteobacteria bacterium]|nr:hypothetical protein LBMAG42_53650 [Deltaproteobacteria bacterium]